MINRRLIQLNPEVESAISSRKPIVALESTVIAHGLPWPQNFETALSLHKFIREAGCMPATIAVLDGKLRVGLNDDEIRLLAESDEIRKVTIRDLPVAMAQKWNGATTVASSIWLAHRAGIKIFATGGIGGVHRGSLPDVSADLPQLARTPIVVVCSGAKIVLDLPATREWLETHGVTVVGYDCDEMPAFYSQRSGLPIDARADSPHEVAEIFHTQQALGMEQALLVAVPVPKGFEVPGQELESAVNRALKEAEHKGISGGKLTPFMLSQMSEASSGATLKSNIALLENNARVAAAISQALSNLSAQSEQGGGAP